MFVRVRNDAVGREKPEFLRTFALEIQKNFYKDIAVSVRDGIIKSNSKVHKFRYFGTNRRHLEKIGSLFCEKY